MSWENAGYGIGTGLIGSLLVALGLKSRLDHLEETVVLKDACTKCSLNNDNQIHAIHDSQVRMEQKLDNFIWNFSRRRGDMKE